eukprot:GEMP01094122.1.p1 GENE.GEMP01094122.1~~GEMP01094122.1.p1  ORF type:complete len:191 (+),score=53.85 GEMP01094122.1:193-765(+)
MKRTIANAFASADDSDEDEAAVPENAKLPRFAQPLVKHTGILAFKKKNARTYYWLEQHKTCRPSEEFASGSSQILGSENKNEETKLRAKFSSAPTDAKKDEEIRKVEQMVHAKDEEAAVQDFRRERRLVGGATICHLCKRKFTSWEKLEEHESFSELHKTNLEKAQNQRGEMNTASKSQTTLAKRPRFVD